MRRSTLAAVLASSSLAVVIPGCCMSPKVCVDPGELPPGETLVPGPGGVRSQTLVIDRVDVNGTATTIGYMSTDPDTPTWTWWLLTDSVPFPINLNAGEALHLSPVKDSAGNYYGRKTGAQLCDLFKTQLTNPKYYKEVSTNTAGVICP